MNLFTTKANVYDRIKNRAYTKKYCIERVYLHQSSIPINNTRLLDHSNKAIIIPGNKSRIVGPQINHKK